MKTIDELLKGCEHDGSYIPVSEVKRLMEAYAQQFQQDKPTDGKIKEESTEEHTTCDGCQMFAECGCMLDDSCPECVEHHLWTPKEDKPTELREELIKFTQKFYADEETCIHNVDEYLKSKANLCTTKDLTDSERKR